MNDHPRSPLSKAMRHGDVNRRWHGIAEAVNRKGCLVAGDGVGSGPQAHFDDILEGLRRKVSEPVDAVAGASENAALGVSSELLARNPGGSCIASSDPARARLGEGVEDFPA